MRLTAFAYRVLLLAFPADVRREFGDDMAHMFAKQVEDARRSGQSTGPLWIRAVADALFNGVVDRLGANERQRVSHARGAGPWGPASARAGGSGGAKPHGSRGRWWVQAFKQDIKYAFRVLAKQPGVTFVAILTLALGIGANSAIFSAVNAVLLRPLPYDNPDRIVTVWEKRPSEGVMDNVVAPADFVDWARMNSSFDGMAAMSSVAADLTGAGDPVRLFAGAVSPPFFDILRVRMLLGRNFRPEEGVIGKHRVVILGHQLWRSRFGADQAIVGRSLALNGIPHEVVGVLPASFEFPDDSLDLWAPLALEGGSEPLGRAGHQFTVYARLKNGVRSSRRG